MYDQLSKRSEQTNKQTKILFQFLSFYVWKISHEWLAIKYPCKICLKCNEQCLHKLAKINFLSMSHQCVWLNFAQLVIQLVKVSYLSSMSWLNFDPTGGVMVKVSYLSSVSWLNFDPTGGVMVKVLSQDLV